MHKPLCEHFFCPSLQLSVWNTKVNNLKSEVIKKQGESEGKTGLQLFFPVRINLKTYTKQQHKLASQMLMHTNHRSHAIQREGLFLLPAFCVNESSSCGLSLAKCEQEAYRSSRIFRLYTCHCRICVQTWRTLQLKTAKRNKNNSGSLEVVLEFIGKFHFSCFQDFYPHHKFYSSECTCRQCTLSGLLGTSGEPWLRPDTKLYKMHEEIQSLRLFLRGHRLRWTTRHCSFLILCCCDWSWMWERHDSFDVRDSSWQLTALLWFLNAGSVRAELSIAHVLRESVQCLPQMKEHWSRRCKKKEQKHSDPERNVESAMLSALMGRRKATRSSRRRSLSGVEQNKSAKFSFETQWLFIQFLFSLFWPRGEQDLQAIWCAWWSIAHRPMNSKSFRFVSFRRGKKQQTQTCFPCISVEILLVNSYSSHNQSPSDWLIKHKLHWPLQ